MSLGKRTRGGQGGKVGHSQMSHWEGTESIKTAHKKHLRQESRSAIRDF